MTDQETELIYSAMKDSQVISLSDSLANQLKLKPISQAPSEVNFMAGRSDGRVPRRFSTVTQ